MSSQLFFSLNLSKQSSPYKYILLNEFQYNDERKGDKKFIAWCKTFDRPNPNVIGSFFENEADNDIVQVLTLGFPFSANDIDFLSKIKKPAPTKTYKKY